MPWQSHWDKKITNLLLILKIWEIIFCFWANYFMDHLWVSAFFSPEIA